MKKTKTEKKTDSEKDRVVDAWHSKGDDGGIRNRRASERESNNRSEYIESYQIAESDLMLNKWMDETDNPPYR